MIISTVEGLQITSALKNYEIRKNSIVIRNYNYIIL